MSVISFTSEDPMLQIRKDLAQIKKEDSLRGKVKELAKSVKESTKESSKEANWKDVTPKVEKIPASGTEEQWKEVGPKKNPAIPAPEAEQQWETQGDKMDTIIKADDKTGTVGNITYDDNKEYFNEEKKLKPKKGIRKSYGVKFKSYNPELIERIAKAVKIELGQEYIQRGSNACSKGKVEAGYPQGISHGMKGPISKSMLARKIEKARKTFKSQDMFKAYTELLKSKYFGKPISKTLMNMIKSYKMKKNMGTSGSGAGVVGVGMGTKNPSDSFKKKKMKKGVKIESGKEYVERGSNAATKAKVEAGYPQGKAKIQTVGTSGSAAQRGANAATKQKVEAGYPQGVSHGMKKN